MGLMDNTEKHHEKPAKNYIINYNNFKDLWKKNP